MPITLVLSHELTNLTNFTNLRVDVAIVNIQISEIRKIRQFVASKIYLMKDLIFALSFLFCNTLFSQGITFETEWKTAVEKATKEKKLIFMDVYIDGCPPCKIFDKDVFTDSAIGRFFNENFVNLRCNAGKSWGVKAAKHYDFFVFPVFVFIDPNSLEIFYRATDYRTQPDALMAQGVIANRERNQPPLSILTEKYEKGNREMRFLKDLMQRKSHLNMDFAKEFFEFIRIFSFEELLKETNLNFGNLTIKYGSAEFQRLKKMQKPNTPSADAIGYILMASVDAVMDTAVKRKDAALMERMLNEKKALGETNQKADYHRIEFYHTIRDSIKAFDYTDIYMQQYLMAETLKSIRLQDSAIHQDFIKDFISGKRDSLVDKEAFEESKWSSKYEHANFFQSQMEFLIAPLIFKIKNKESLKKMLLWSNYALELMPNSFLSMQNHAILLYKNGENTKAISLFSKAIERVNNFKSENKNDATIEGLVEMKEQLEKMKKGIL
jgi:Thioredoxin-like